jgi:uncharacterized protein (DUF433 family)
MSNPKSEPVIVRQPGVQGGRPTFRGTRVQAEILFENLAEGYSIDEILESFPTLDREEVRLALQQACDLLMQSAPQVATAREPETMDAVWIDENMIETPRQRIDLTALRALTDSMPLQPDSAREFVRRMRDEDRY